MSKSAKRNSIIIAQFANPAELLSVAKKIREAGYKDYDCHSPFPIHGMDRAMGLKRSPIGWIVGILATIGGGGALWMQWWTGAVDYPLVIAGKPLFSFQAYFPVVFGLAVLLGAFAAVFGMILLNKLPRLFHPVFYSSNFEKCSDDGFFVTVEATDPKFDVQKTQEFLKSLGGNNLEAINC